MTTCTPSPVSTRLEIPSILSNSSFIRRASEERMARTPLGNPDFSLAGVSRKSSLPWCISATLWHRSASSR